MPKNRKEKDKIIAVLVEAEVVKKEKSKSSTAYHNPNYISRKA